MTAGVMSTEIVMAENGRYFRFWDGTHEGSQLAQGDGVKAG